MRVSCRVTNWAMMSPIVNHQPVPKSQISRATRKESLMERGPKQRRKHRLVRNKTKSRVKIVDAIFLGWTSQQREKKLKHPVAHYRLRDPFWQFLFSAEIIYDGNYRRANYFSLSSRWRVPKPEWQAAQLLMFFCVREHFSRSKKKSFVSTFDIAPLWDQRLSCRVFNQQSITFPFVVSILLSVPLIQDRRCFPQMNCVINAPPAILQFLS